MSAIEETGTAAAVVGKDTGDGTQPSAGGVHPAPTFPHLAYGDAVHAELAAAGLPPDVLDTGVRTETPGRRRELFFTLSWLTGHPDLSDPTGLDLIWSHLIGWAARIDNTVRVLDVDELAAPAVLADAALHLAVHGLEQEWVIPVQARWEDALELDIALVHFDERNQPHGREVLG